MPVRFGTVALLLACAVTAACGEGGNSTSSTTPEAPGVRASTVTPVSTRTTSPPIATATTGAVSYGCAESLPELPAAGETLIFALCGFDTPLPYPVVRQLLPGLGNVESAVTSLMRGTTEPERANGLSVGFDSVERSKAARMKVEAEIDDSGLLHLGFVLDGEPWHPGTLAGTSSQAFSFADPLYATVFQFPEVAGIGPGSLCWGELDCTKVFTREMWESMIRANAGREVGSGCGVLGAWFDPACGSSLPLCDDRLEVQPAEEGATGSAVYYLEIKAPDPCFVTLDGMVTVLSADGTVAQVDGSPVAIDLAGVVTDGFAALDGAMPLWVMRNWCEDGGVVRIEVNGRRYDEPAGGRCDAADEPATLATPDPGVSP